MTAAYHWRSIRARLMLAGIADPLAQLPDLHALLDIAENVILEGKANEGGDALQRYLFQTYKPEIGEKPVGFEEEDQLAAFGAFAEGLGDLR